MEVNETQKKVEPKFDSQVKENSEKISEPVDSADSHHDHTTRTKTKSKEKIQKVPSLQDRTTKSLTKKKPRARRK